MIGGVFRLNVAFAKPSNSKPLTVKPNMNDYAPARRSFLKTRTIDVTFTVILGLLTVVFGYYVFTSIRNFKAAKTKKALVAKVVPHHKTIRHKLKHRAKTFAKSAPSKIPVIDTAEVVSSQPKPILPHQIYADKNSMGSTTIADVSSSDTKPGSETQSTEKQPVKEALLPYTTYLRANETGIINMRKFADYGSEIIKTIPTNSEVSVLERGPVYYKVLFENTTGYVAKWNVIKK